MATIKNVTIGKEIIMELPFKPGQVVYQVYNDGKTDWSDNRFGIDRFTIQSVLVSLDSNGNNIFNVSSTTEATWNGNIESLKTKFQFSIKEAIAELNRIMNEPAI